MAKAAALAGVAAAAAAVVVVVVVVVKMVICWYWYVMVVLCLVMRKVTFNIFVKNKHKRNRKFVPVNVRIFHFICDHRKMDVATREN